MDLKHISHLTLLFKKQVGIMGTIHFWGLTIDIVTTICVVLAVGLSVDYSSHIGHTFMIRSGTRKGKLGKRDPCSQETSDENTQTYQLTPISLH